MAKDKNKIPVYHPHKNGSGGSGGSSGGSGGGNGSSGSGGGSGHSGKSGGDSASSAKHKAARRYIDSAETLAKQARALRLALGDKGFRHALQIKLHNIQLVQGQQDSELVKGYRERVGSLQMLAADNQKAVAADSFANLSNAGRERANALSESMMQGAGESDVLQAQGAALRNWEANQTDTQRSFFDTQASINSSLTDLTVDTRTARVNNVMQSNADRAQLYSNYYDQRSQTLTALGNTLGQMAEDYGFAAEMDGSGKKKRKQAAHDSGNAFRRASLVMGRAYHDPGVSGGLRNWSGAAPFDDAAVNQANRLAPDVDLAKPEGATLRRWEQ